MLGRVTVTKTLLLSKLTFLILTLPNPSSNFFKELDCMFYNFIWRGNDRVSRNQMIQGYSHGGVKMVDMHSVTWIRRFLNSDNLGWVTLFLKILNIYDPLALKRGHYRHC